MLCLIPARSGSKRLPGKNWLTVGGKTLVQRAVECAPDRYETVIITDAPDRCDNLPAYVLDEPAELAGDDVSMLRVLQWFVDKWHGWYPNRPIVLLQPTSPLRTQEDVAGCIDLAMWGPTASVVSMVGVKRGRHFAYEHNGAVYVTTPKLVESGQIIGGHVRFYVMPPERSVDIDTAEDLEEARRIAGP